MEKKLIIFDLGGVIIDYKGSQYYSYLHGKTGIGMETIEEKLRPLIDKLERKKCSVKEFERDAKARLGISASSIEWVGEFKRDSRLNECVAKLVDALGKRYAVVALSNIDVGRYRAAIGKFGRMGFKRIFASCYIGKRKPEKGIFMHVLKETGFSAKEAIFIDDLKKNVEGARNAGIDAIRFEDCASLKKSLENIGLNLGRE